MHTRYIVGNIYFYSEINTNVVNIQPIMSLFARYMSQFPMEKYFFLLMKCLQIIKALYGIGISMPQGLFVRSCFYNAIKRFNSSLAIDSKIGTSVKAHDVLLHLGREGVV